MISFTFLLESGTNIHDISFFFQHFARKKTKILPAQHRAINAPILIILGIIIEVKVAMLRMTKAARLVRKASHIAAWMALNQAKV